jgi:hypothetical protein
MMLGLRRALVSALGRTNRRGASFPLVTPCAARVLFRRKRSLSVFAPRQQTTFGDRIRQPPTKSGVVAFIDRGAGLNIPTGNDTKRHLVPVSYCYRHSYK